MSKKLLHRSLIFVFALILLNHCGNPEKKPEAANNSAGSITEEPTPSISITDTLPAQVAVAPEEEKSALTETPASAKDADKTWVMYVPEKSQDQVKFPVAFIFDPHANGNLPVSKYKKLADEFGMVLAGSNVSRNGQPIEQGLEIYNQMKAGVEKSAQIDLSRIYTLGFSGGARVAVSIAISDPEVNAVIGCGAGFPAVQQMPQANFYYFGLVGYEDFNMNELINNDRLLSRSGFTNELVIFDGDHNWPPAGVMREAFLAVSVNNIRSEVIERDEALIQKAKSYYQDKTASYVEAGRYFDAAETAGRAVSVLKGLTDISTFENEQRSAMKNPGYKKDLSQMVTTMEQEAGLQNNYLEAFTKKDMEWWKNELTGLNAPANNIFEIRKNKRLLGFLGLVSFMMTNNAIAENNLVQAQKNVDIYRLVEPLNPEHAYLNAIIKMKTGDAHLALEYLKQARFLGFNNGDRLMQEEAFLPLHSNPDFDELFN